MGTTSIVSLFSQPQVSLNKQRLHSRFTRSFGSFYRGCGVQFPPATVSVSVSFGSTRKCLRFRGLVVRADSRADGGSTRRATGRRVYREAQGELTPAPIKQVVSFVAPAGVFFAVTFADSFVEIGGETPYSKAKEIFVSGK